MRVAVQLEDCSGLDGLVHHCIEVDLICLSRQQKPTSRMPEDRETWIFHHRQHPPCHGCFVHPELRVNRSDYVIEHVERVIAVIEAAVGKDVGFDPLQDPEPFCLAVELVYLLVLPQDLVTLHASCVEGGLRMIGDADVLPPPLLRRACHFLDGCAAVGPRRVTMQCTLDVFTYEKIRK